MRHINSIQKLLFALLFFGTFGCAETPPDYPYKEQVRCGENNGECTADPMIICPPGTEPLTWDDPRQTNCLGHCCVAQEKNNSCNPAPEDTDDFSLYNCVLDDDGVSCPGSWREVEGNLSCEEGRSCCYWP